MIKRSVLSNIEEHLKEPEMSVLIGPRQAGKTYIMQILQKKLNAKEEKTLFLSLDIDDHKPFFASQSSLINYIRLHAGDAKAYVFVDEIQRKEDAGLFLKGIYDRQLPYKFIVSGSGSLDLKTKIKESMAGRKKLFKVLPLSFEEFVNFKTNYQYEDSLQEFFSIETVRTKGLFEEYMAFGGYPRVVLANVVDKKKSEMDEIYTSYIERDIINLLRVDKPGAFTDLLKIMASQIGNLVNVTELSSTVGITNKTVQHYLWYLEQTFILKKITPYHRNVRSEITKAPIFYFYDTGLRNYLLGLFGLPRIPGALSGHLFQNFVYKSLEEKIYLSPTTIHFWRSKDKAEVDFVVDTVQEIIPVEVKYTKLKSAQTTRSFKSFLNKYKPKKAYVVHLGEDFEDSFEKTKIYFIPFFKCGVIIT